MLCPRYEVLSFFFTAVYVAGAAGSSAGLGVARVAHLMVAAATVIRRGAFGLP